MGVNLCVKLILLFASTYYWPGAGAVRRPTRSVVQCDRHSSVVGTFTDNISCHVHCERTYVNINRDSRLINKGLFEARLMHEIAEGNLNQEQWQQQQQQQQQQVEAECCCSFEAPWPQWIGPQAIGREVDVAIMKDKSWDKRVCMPLVMPIGLSKRTRDSYDIMCRHLREPNPLTMLELMQFVEAAAYLNYMAPKHPAIMLVMRDKQVKSIQKTEAQELRNALFEYLLDDTYQRQLIELPGYRLDIGRLRLLIETKRRLARALKSEIIYRAFEELAISQLLMDLAAVSYKLQELNHNQLHIPKHLLAGNYDKYDTNLATYFSLQSAKHNCRALAHTNVQVESYLSALKSLLSSFREKSLYEQMSQKFRPLVDILHTQKVYQNLIRVNCNGQDEKSGAGGRTDASEQASRAMSVRYESKLSIL